MKDVLESAKVIHKLDPDRQVWQVFCGLQLNNWELVTPYLSGTDVVCLGQYCETDKRKAFEGCDSALFHVTNNTAFASQLKLPCSLTVQAMGGDKEILPQYRIPTYGEFRWNVFSGLTSGGRSVDLFIMPAKISRWQTDPNDFIDFVENTVTPVFGELKQIKYAMETGYNVGKVKIIWDGRYEELKLWSKNFDGMSQLLLYDAKEKCYFLIVTNNTSKDRNFEITLSQLPARLRKGDSNKAVEMRTGKTVILKYTQAHRYQLEDAIDGYGVMLYRISSN